MLGNNYQCYDCSQQFPSLVGLGNHSQDSPWHSQERCLMCCDHILVYLQVSPPQVVRLHTCKKDLLRYQNPDLQVLACEVSKALGWQAEKNPEEQNNKIPCDTCDQLFQLNISGLYKFLEHSNITSHNIVNRHYCKKCSMPEILLNVCHKQYLTHYCTKESSSTITGI